MFPLAVSLMDRFLSASLALPVSPYCLAASCILIASKLTECDNVSADSLCAAAESGFQPPDLRVSAASQFTHSFHSNSDWCHRKSHSEEDGAAEVVLISWVT